MSEPKSLKSKKLPYGGLSAVPPFALQGLGLWATTALAPGFPNRAVLGFKP